MQLDPTVWGPPYWFVLLTIAHGYPLNPNTVTKKKYYDFIQNLPLFLPKGELFLSLIDKYPVTPYLDGRESFIRWVVFIHNKVNVALGKDPITIEKALDDYFSQYKTIDEVSESERKRREKWVGVGAILILFMIATFLFRK
jgi:hypothetical protein